GAAVARGRALLRPRARVEQEGRGGVREGLLQARGEHRAGVGVGNESPGGVGRGVGFGESVLDGNLLPMDARRSYPVIPVPCALANLHPSPSATNTCVYRLWTAKALPPNVPRMRVAPTTTAA